MSLVLSLFSFVSYFSGSDADLNTLLDEIASTAGDSISDEAKEYVEVVGDAERQHMPIWVKMNDRLNLRSFFSEGTSPNTEDYILFALLIRMLFFGFVNV